MISCDDSVLSGSLASWYFAIILCYLALWQVDILQTCHNDFDTLATWYFGKLIIWVVQNHKIGTNPGGWWSGWERRPLEPLITVQVASLILFQHSGPAWEYNAWANWTTLEHVGAYGKWNWFEIFSRGHSLRPWQLPGGDGPGGIVVPETNTIWSPKAWSWDAPKDTAKLTKYPVGSSFRIPHWHQSRVINSLISSSLSLQGVGSRFLIRRTRC